MTTPPTTTENAPHPGLRIGAVNYLNSKPLVQGLAERAVAALGPETQLRFDLPSRLADSLAAGRLDVALIPVVEFLANPNYQMVSDACVASDGPVLSVKVYFRTPPAEVRTLALDEGSRTSAALAQILLHQRHGVRPALTPLPIGCGLETSDADAVLLIGDRAMLPPQEEFVAEWDLGAEWRAETGLPFVFACWAATKSQPTETLSHVLSTARDAGVAAIEQIATDATQTLGIEIAFAVRYLSKHLHFTLGPRERQAIQLYRQHCQALGLLPTPVVPVISQ